MRLRLPGHALDELKIQRLKRILREHPGDSVVQIDIGQGKVLRLADEFRVDLDRSVGELRMAFGHDAVLLYVTGLGDCGQWPRRCEWIVALEVATN